MSPAAAVIEAVALRWTLDALRLATSGGAFVLGATMANFTAWRPPGTRCWRAPAGMSKRRVVGAPPITVVVGDEVHVTWTQALSLLGLGA